MKGHMRERSPGHWAIVIDVRDLTTGKRKRKWHSFKGTKREAQIKQAELIAAMSHGSYVERSKITVVEFVGSRIDQWEAAGTITARTAQRYRQLTENQIAQRKRRPAVETLPCLVSWLTPCASIARPRLSYGCSSGQGASLTTRCCSQRSRAPRYRQMPNQPPGLISRTASTCRT